MTTATIQQLSNKDLSLVLKKYISKGSYKLELAYAFIDEEYITATDGHQLIKIRREILESTPQNGEHFYSTSINAYMDLNVSYPLLYKKIGNFPNSHIDINKSEINKFVAAIGQFKKESPKDKFYDNKIHFSVNNGHLIGQCHYFTGVQETKDTYTIETGIEVDQDVSFIINLEYFVNMLRSFKKIAKVTKEKGITLNWESSMKPIIFTSEFVEITIMPCRY